MSRQHWRNGYWQSAAVGCLGIFACIDTIAVAQITPDGSLGAEGSTVTRDVLIRGLVGDRIDGGAIRGANLFHSFEQFNIDAGRAAYFTNPAGIQNILSRVTGSTPSTILGRLGVLGSANLFFINPNGILFGPNASLDVGGSFVATTANAVQFGEQGSFSATNPEVPGLLTVNPSAFFFNQLPAGSITNLSTAPAGFDPAGGIVIGLRVPDGQSLLLLGGDVTLNRGWLNALGGRVELGGLAAPGTVEIMPQASGLSLRFPNDVTRSNVSLMNAALVAVNSANGGSLTISAQNLTLSGGSSLYAGIRNFLGTESSQAGDITLDVTGGIAFDNSFIYNNVQIGAIGQAGNINIRSGSLSITNNAAIVASTYGQGNAGSVFVQAEGAVFLDRDAYIFSTVEAGGVGDGGGINLSANSLDLQGGSQLITVVQSASGSLLAGRGNGGDINISVQGTVNIAGVGQFRSGIFSSVYSGASGNAGSVDIQAGAFSLADNASISTSTSGQGNAGNVFVRVEGAVFLDRDAYIFSTVEAGGVGDSGSINLSANSLDLRGGAGLVAGVQPASGSLPAGQGNGGDVNISVQGAVNIAGVGQFRSGIFTSVDHGAVGNGGSITIATDSLTLSDSAQLTASTYGQGDGGNIVINVRDTFVSDGSNVLSAVFDTAIGNGGDITISAGSLFLYNASTIATSALGRGAAGNIQVNVRDAVVLRGRGTNIQSAIYAGAIGQSGDITINTGTLSLANDVLGIASLTNGPGSAGNIRLNARDSIAVEGGVISSVVGTDGQGQGGNLDISTGSLLVTNGAQLNASTYGQGNAGNITIEAQDTASFAGVGSNGNLSGAYSLVESNAQGDGGDIRVSVGSLSLTDGARLSAGTFGQGDAGDVVVEAHNAVFLDGRTQDSNFFSGIFSSVEETGQGQGGNIRIHTDSLTLSNSAILIARTAGQGNAGSVTVEARGRILLKNGGISSVVETTGNGQGGDIYLVAEDIRLLDDGNIFSFAIGAGGGGNITLTANSVIALDDSDILAFAQDGKGGNITLNTRAFFGQNYRPATPGTNLFALNRNARVDINATGTVSGIITLPDSTFIQNSLAQLSQNLIDTNTLLADSCIVRSKQRDSSFLITGSGGLPVRPGDAAVSTFPTGTIRSVSNGESEQSSAPARRAWKMGDPIVEPQGVYRLPDGRLVLSRECED